VTQGLALELSAAGEPGSSSDSSLALTTSTEREDRLHRERVYVYSGNVYGLLGPRDPPHTVSKHFHQVGRRFRTVPSEWAYDGAVPHPPEVRSLPRGRIWHSRSGPVINGDSESSHAGTGSSSQTVRTMASPY